MTDVLVASVGVVGTVIGASISAFVAARAEKRRDAALERQRTWQAEENRRQGAQEHQKWRRERRQAAYLRFLDLLNAADRANQEQFRELKEQAPPVPVDTARLAGIRQAFKDAEASGHVVLLEGPEPVARAAQQLLERLATLIAEVRAYAETHAASGSNLADRGESIEGTGQMIIAEHRTFLAVARTALDEGADAHPGVTGST
jgi:hypothetical protein